MRGWKVDLENAELVVHIELLSDEAFYFSGRSAVPVGCQQARPAEWPVFCRAELIRPLLPTG